METFEAELAKATSLGNEDLVGAVAVVIDNNGNFLYKHAAGRQFLSAESPPLDPDCTITLASAGHFWTNIAALQLIERGLLTLDEPIRKCLPEIDQCLVIERIGDEGEAEQSGEKMRLHSPARGVTLRDLLLNTSGIGTTDTYKERFGSGTNIPTLDLPADAPPMVKNQSTHLFFEPGEGFEYGWSIFYVQLLVQRLGNEQSFLQYVDKHIFGPLGMTASTYQPALVPHIWTRRLQMVGRELDTAETDSKTGLAPRDDGTYGLTCSISDLARLFGDIISPDCKLLQLQEHRDMLFAPQLEPDSRAHQGLVAETTNYGFLLPLEHGVSHKVSWALRPPPAINWTVAGVLLEENDTIPGSGIPKGTVAFEGQPNVIWTMNREKGRIMLFGNQILPGYDVKAHNLAIRFLYDAWKTFG